MKQSSKRIRVALNSPDVRKEMILPFMVVPQIGDDVLLFGRHWDVESLTEQKIPDDQGCSHEIHLRFAS